MKQEVRRGTRAAVAHWLGHQRNREPVGGFDVLKLPRSYDTGLVAVFRDRAGLEAYTVHPEHIKVAAFGKTISEQVASVDFES